MSEYDFTRALGDPRTRRRLVVLILALKFAVPYGIAGAYIGSQLSEREPGYVDFGEAVAGIGVNIADLPHGVVPMASAAIRPPSPEDYGY